MYLEVFKGVFKDVRRRMEKSVEKVREELRSIRTGRASTHLFDHIYVDYYGTQTPITQVATLRIPEPHLIIIQPWEPRMLKVIEKAILSSDLGVNPINDGKVLKVPIPKLTEERRKQLVKHVWKIAEEGKTAIRHIRRDGNEEVKRMEKEKKCSEDDAYRAREEIQKITDECIKKIESLAKDKEKEIMTI